MPSHFVRRSKSPPHEADGQDISHTAGRRSPGFLTAQGLDRKASAFLSGLGCVRTSGRWPPGFLHKGALLLAGPLVWSHCSPRQWPLPHALLPHPRLTLVACSRAKRFLHYQYGPTPATEWIGHGCCLARHFALTRAPAAGACRCSEVYGCCVRAQGLVARAKLGRTDTGGEFLIVKRACGGVTLGARSSQVASDQRSYLWARRSLPLPRPLPRVIRRIHEGDPPRPDPMDL
jgi:hypothetical protein